MGVHRTTSWVVGPPIEALEAHERVLLDQMTAPFGACSTCGTDGLFLTFWTPWRTVQTIVCACCGRQFWSAPNGR